MIRNLAPFAAVVAILAAVGSAGVAVPGAHGCTSSITITSLTVPDAYQPGGTGPRYVGNSFLVRLEATSNCQIQTVVAEAFGRTTSLAFQSGTRWQGTVPIAGDPHGPFTLTGRVTDINGTSVSSTLELVHDTPPVVTVTSPIQYSVARPSVRVTASCADDAPGGCVSFIVRGDGQTLLSGANQYDQDVSLASFGEQEVQLEFVGSDGIGTRQVIVQRTVYVVTNPRLTEVARVPEGWIEDANQTHVLFFNPDTNGPLARQNQSTGEMQVLAPSFTSTSVARLTARGALYPVEEAVNFTVLYELRDGAISERERPVAPRYLEVEGNYALWVSGNSGVRYDLEQGATIHVDPGGFGADDLASNGDVIVTSGEPTAVPVYHVQRFRDGVTTRLATVKNDYFSPRPLTDGINVAYRHHDGSLKPIIRLITATDDLLLSTFPTPGRDYAPTPGRDYALAGGWTTFKRYSGPAGNIWRHSPGGEETQVTFFGDDTVQIHALNDDGRMVVTRGARMYLSQPGQPLEDLTLYAGDATQAFWRGSRLYVSVGTSLFKLGLSPFTDAVMGPGSTVIRAVHITELRERIDAVRSQWGLAPYSYTDPELAAGRLVIMEHFTELRTALSEAYSAAGRTLPAYTDPVLVRGMTIAAAHLAELRGAVVALE
jgi:hypothetical protein